MKIAFMFSGQGSEKLNMGKDLFDSNEIVRETFLEANKALDFDISNICFNDYEKLKDTSYAQPALLTLSTSILNVLIKENIKYDYTLGLSLGEYSAFVASGALSFLDAVKLVNKRGCLMKSAFNNVSCKMAAVLNTPIQVIENIIDDCKQYGLLEIANYNTSKQIVISGEENAVLKATENLKKEGYKSILLNVNGAFHTSMLYEASLKLNKELNKIKFSDIKIPVVTNLDASFITNKDKIVDILTKQVRQSVYFEKSILNLIDKRVTTFVEIGVGKTLTSFVKKIDKSVKVFNIEDTKTLYKALEILK